MGGGNLDLSKRVEEWGSKETEENQRLGPDRILPSKAEGGLERIVDLELYIIGFPSCPAAHLFSCSAAQLVSSTILFQFSTLLDTYDSVFQV